MKDEYMKAISTIITKFTTNIEPAALEETAQSILESGLSCFQQLSKNPSKENIFAAIDELSNVNTYEGKIISVMTLAFALGTMKLPIPVATELFDTLLFKVFSKGDAEVAAIKAMMASMFTTAEHNSPF